MNQKQDWTTATGPFKLIKKPIGFFSSYESRQEITKKSKPSKIAQLNFIKKIRNMRKKIKYLTEAEQSEDDNPLHKKYCSSADSQTPCSQQYLKRKAPFNNNQDQIFRKLLKVEEDKNENQENQFNENSHDSQENNSEFNALTRYFQQEKEKADQEPHEDNT